MQAEGTLGQTDDTGFRRRYGTTYVLLDEGEGGVSYALKSDTEDLGKYAGQHVRLSGSLVRQEQITPLANLDPDERSRAQRILEGVERAGYGNQARR